MASPGSLVSTIVLDRESSATRLSAPRGIDQSLNVHTAVISRLLRGQRFTAIEDLVEAAKRVCATSRIPYSTGPLRDAAERLHAQRRGGILAATPRSTRPEQQAERSPISRREAPALLTLIEQQTGRHLEIRPWR